MSFKPFKLAFLSLLSITGVIYTVKHKSLTLTNTKREDCSKKEKLWNSMAAQVDSWIDALGKPIDPLIKETVIVLNLLGFKTSQSCEGHMDWGNSYPWVSFDIDDSDTEPLSQERAEIRDKIKKKQQELMQKHPNPSGVNVAAEDPELISLRERSKKLGDQMERLPRIKFIRLKDLIDKFYKKHTENYDRTLFLSDSVGSQYWLISIGSHWQVTRDAGSKLKKLLEYQEEMRLFTKFLKNYYWSDFVP